MQTIRDNMSEGHLVWEPVIFEDPDGGRILLWPHLPCVRMPTVLRTREHWDGIALLASEEEISGWPHEEKEDQESPGIHVAAAMASGTVLGRLLDDLTVYDVDGPTIPDPEDWMTRAADEQVSMSSLISSVTIGRRWKKLRHSFAILVEDAKGVDAELGAAAASSATWWQEENRGLTAKLISERSSRIVSRIRGALADLREGIVDDSDTTGPSLMVPVHQPRLPSLVRAFHGYPDSETIQPIQTEEA